MSGEKTEVRDLVEGFGIRNFITYDQNAAIENVKRVLAPHWQL